MNPETLIDCLERSPIIASFSNIDLEHALSSPAEVIFDLKANIRNVQKNIELAHKAGKYYFVHIDLAEGIGKDKSAIEYLAECGLDGIISTRGQLIKFAKESGLLTVQRLFALDTHGVGSISDLLGNSSPDFIEIMPGVIGKVIEKFARGSIPVIAGGLIETKAEVTDALANGAIAVSTGMSELWYL